MKLFATFADLYSRWIDAVAATVALLLGGLASPRLIRLVEEESGELVVQADQQVTDLIEQRIRSVDGKDSGASGVDTTDLQGCRVELMLRPEQFLFRSLELPPRAAEFLDGIICAQIDRLTPWTAAEAAFGWGRPSPIQADRITVAIAATPLDRVTPCVDRIVELGARSVTVLTEHLDGGAAIPIKVFEKNARGSLDLAQIRHVLTIVLAVVMVSAASAVAMSAAIGQYLDARQEELALQIRSARSAAGAGDDAGSDLALERALEQRKRGTPPIVLVIEMLSRILPEDTYLTELQVEGNKLRLIGMTRDAPALIGLLENSGHFAHATFFAPTTRSSSEPTELFHIEVQIQPMVTAQR
jgi:general secretion pathway protein L